MQANPQFMHNFSLAIRCFLKIRIGVLILHPSLFFFIFVFLIYSSKTREDTLLLCCGVICYGLLKRGIVIYYRVKILSGHLLWRVKMLTAIARN